MTPRKFQALLDVHFNVLRKMQGSGGKGKGNKVKSAPVHGFIDQIPGF